MSKLYSWEIRDPAALIEDVADQESLTEGTALLALVEHPSTKQRLVRVERLATGSEIFEYESASDEVRSRIRNWPLPEVHPARHCVVLIVVRPGFCVFGPNEGEWCMALRYLNHFCAVSDGDMILVTEHGWGHFFSDLGGHLPAMESSAA